MVVEDAAIEYHVVQETGNAPPHFYVDPNLTRHLRRRPSRS